MTEETYTIKVAKDFSDTPGGRYKREGQSSGEEFRDKILIPKYKQAKESGKKLFIDLDGTYGYLLSFIDESFGKIAEYFPRDKILDTIIIKSDDQPGLKEKIDNFWKKTIR